ncbi:MAG: DUF4214 domain-containing protein [Archangium sp.]|nr:DUF4214 domain-containing protein [Archangium sp.]
MSSLPVPAAESKPAGAALDAHAWLLLFVSLTSVIGTLLLSASVFSVPVLLGSTFSACLLVHRLGGVSISAGALRWSWGAALLLALALMLRADIYPHLMGGQDQGLYTNYSIVMLREGALSYVDHFRQELPDRLKAVYDARVMASISLQDPATSLMTIEFYPLHPMWMAVFSWIAGPAYRTLSLLFFAVVTIWSAKKLAQELFASEGAGWLAAFLIATNPVLVFFSKFPVTEMVALAFSLNGFLYLLLGGRAPELRQKLSYLAIAVLCFCSFFFTRIHFMLYLPFLALLLVGAVAFDWKQSLRSGVAPTVIVLGVLFGLSLGWYYVFQRALVTALFEVHLSRLMSFSVLASATLAAGCLTVCLFLVRRFSRPELFRRPVSWTVEHSGKFLVLAFLLWVPSLVSLYRTGAMHPFDYLVLDLSDPWLFRYHVLYRLILFISPVGMLALIGGALFARGLPEGAGLLMLLLASACGVVMLQPWVPYLFYYGRYLSSDVLPYALMVLAGLLMHFAKAGRRLAVGATVLIVGAYQLFFSFSQSGFVESEAPGTYDGFLAHARENDVILAVGMDDRLLVPLRVAYELRVFAVKSLKATEEVRPGDLVDLQALALKGGGRLLIASSLADPQKLGSFMGGASFRNSFFTNGEHLRAGIFQRKDALAALLLPLRRDEREERWVFYDATAFDFTQGPPAATGLVEEPRALPSAFTFPAFPPPGEGGRWERAYWLVGSLEGASDADYVRGLYRDLLGREADPDGLRLHVTGLAQGGSREALRQTFRRSAEYREKHTRQGE